MSVLFGNQSAVLRAWLPIVFAATMFFGTLYAVLQQHIRTEANSPQIQLAQDIASQLYQNQTPTATNTTNAAIDIERSLSPFIVLYNSNGRPVDGNGMLDNKLPNLPSGVLDYTAKHVEDRITWQPKDDTRIAAVVRYYQNNQHAGYVLAGRNLKEAEIEQNRILLIIAVGWAISLMGSLALCISVRHRPQPGESFTT